MQPPFVLLATSGALHYSTIVSKTAWLLGWMYSREVGELMDVGPSRFTGYTYVENIGGMILPLVRAMMVPDPEPL